MKSIDNIRSASGGGGLTQEEHDALMSLASMPARGDWNPEKISTDIYAIVHQPSTGGSELAIAHCNVVGYDKIAVRVSSSSPTVACQFLAANGDVISNISISTSWSNYISIPENAVCVYAKVATYPGMIYISMLTKDSPYNPDNQ